MCFKLKYHQLLSSVALNFKWRPYILERKIHPPITPQITHPLDTQHFDEYDEDGDTEEDYEAPLEVLDELFSNF